MEGNRSAVSNLLTTSTTFTFQFSLSCRFPKNFFLSAKNVSNMSFFRCIWHLYRVSFPLSIFFYGNGKKNPNNLSIIKILFSYWKFTASGGSICLILFLYKNILFPFSYNLWHIGNRGFSQVGFPSFLPPSQYRFPVVTC